MSEYEKYQLQWMLDHGYSLRELIRELDDERQDHHPQASLMEVFDDWEMNTGFMGNIWACENEWEDCEARMPMKPQVIRLPLETYKTAIGEFQLRLTAEENPGPEFGPEIIVGLSDGNDNYLQDLVTIREREHKTRDGKAEPAIETLIWTDETSESYTDRNIIKIYPVLKRDTSHPDEYMSEDLARKCPDNWVKTAMDLAEENRTTPDEALKESLSIHGIVDMGYMTKVTDMEEDELFNALRGKVFPMPEPHDENGEIRYFTEEQLLTGTHEQLEKRLREAMAMADTSPDFDEEVIALQKNLCGKCFTPDHEAIKAVLANKGSFDSYGIPHFTEDVFNSLHYAGNSITEPGKRSLMLPTEYGPSLFIEDKHFVIDRKE